MWYFSRWIVRLDKFVSYTLDITRSDSKRLIKAETITVNDKLITDIGFNIDENVDIVKYLDDVLEYEKYIYLMLNKPQGYISATIGNEPTVLDLISEYKKYKLSIVGRLDKDTEGLILLTNDGALNHILTSPKSSIYKKYYVEVAGVFKEEDVELFKNGLNITDGKGNLYTTLPAKLEIINKTSAYISIKEGKYHQVKKMCSKVGKEVVYLKRIQIGKINLDPNLELGEYRKLEEDEIKYLNSLT